MGILNFSLMGAGAALIVVGYLRGRAPWARYQALKDEDANVARYEAWRGGLRDSGKTGASVAMDILRGQIRSAAVIAGIGVVLVIAGFALPA
jgi:hypothetical protein